MTAEKERGEIVERAARAVERAQHPEWSDKMFEVWWSRDPFFCEKETAWTNFRGTRKAYAIWLAGVALQEGLTTYDEGFKAGIEAAAKAAGNQPFYPDTHTGMRQQWIKDQITTAIRALAQPEPAAVKQLEWAEIALGVYPYPRAETSIGSFSAGGYSDGGFYFTAPNSDPDEPVEDQLADSLEEAKAAAQAVFWLRVRSCLE